jgi:hypothetical protein
MDEQDKQANQVNQTKQANKMLDYAPTNQALDCGCKVPIPGETNNWPNAEERQKERMERHQLRLIQAEHSKEIQDFNRRIYNLEGKVNRFNNIFENIINAEIRRRLLDNNIKESLTVNGPVVGINQMPYPKY